MNRAEFEASLRQEGYEVREGEIEPHRHLEAHAHEFDARILVLDGSITLVFGTDRVTYRPGDSCNVPAGTMHKEHTEADGHGTWRGAAHQCKHPPQVGEAADLNFAGTKPSGIRTKRILRLGRAASSLRPILRQTTVNYHGLGCCA